MLEQDEHRSIHAAVADTLDARSKSRLSLYIKAKILYSIHLHHIASPRETHAARSTPRTRLTIPHGQPRQHVSRAAPRRPIPRLQGNRSLAAYLTPTSISQHHHALARPRSRQRRLRRLQRRLCQTVRFHPNPHRFRAPHADTVVALRPTSRQHGPFPSLKPCSCRRPIARSST